jgi:hypothetical protein
LQDLQDAEAAFKSNDIVQSIIEISGGKSVKQRIQQQPEKVRFGDIDHDASISFPDHDATPVIKTLKYIPEIATLQVTDKFENGGKKAGNKNGNITSDFNEVKHPDGVLHSGSIGGANVFDQNRKGEKVNRTISSIGCQVINDRAKTTVSMPFKIYVYDMPAMFTTRAINCINQSTNSQHMDLGNCGFGANMHKDDIMLVHDTHQFALEVLIHHKMLTSPYRTLNPGAADIFYAPIYGGPLSYCDSNSSEKIRIVKDFFKFLKRSDYFREGRPHLSALGRIQRENAHSTWPLLAHRDSHRILYLTIEKEIRGNLSLRGHNPKVKVIPVPYPSYAHYHPDGLLKEGNEFRLSQKNFLQRERNVYLFWAAGSRQSNQLRANIIMPQFNSTELSYEQYMSGLKTKKPQSQELADPSRLYVPIIWLLTPEFQSFHHNITIQWMQHSVFCLQPAGDSPTRKSIYDAIAAGCIPVLFDNRYGEVAYPFSTRLNYKEFTVSLSLSDQTKMNYLEIIKSRYSSKDIKRLQQRLFQVAHMFQYSYPLNNGEQKDAMGPIMDEVKKFFKL